MDMKLKHKEQKSEINSFKFHLFMLSNAWMVQLIAVNLWQVSFALHLPPQ